MKKTLHKKQVLVKTQKLIKQTSNVKTSFGDDAKQQL
jgi:hypothetical protein